MDGNTDISISAEDSVLTMPSSWVVKSRLLLIYGTMTKIHTLLPIKIIKEHFQLFLTLSRNMSTL